MSRPILLLLALLIMATLAGCAAGPAPAAAAVAEKPASDGFRAPLAELADGKAHYYKHEADGKTIAFFLLKSSDGEVRAAFDACDVCFPARLGYRQEGDQMVCNNCGNRFASRSINVVSGGCNPAPLDRMIEGDYVVIQTADIEAGARYF